MLWIKSNRQANCGGNYHEYVRDCTYRDGDHGIFIKIGDDCLWDKKAGVVYCEQCGRDIVSQGIKYKPELKRVYKGVNDAK